MNVALALLLGTPLLNCWAALPFQDMLDSTQLVVIAKVDSMWTLMDTIPSTTDNTKPYHHITEQIHVSAKILALYAKTDSLSFPSGWVHIAYSSGRTFLPDGGVIHTSGTPSYRLGETFLVPLFESSWLHSETEPIYRGTMTWKYTVHNDSIFLYCEDTYLSLAEAIDSLSSHFIRIKTE
jgi:hypothetical protein